MQAEPRQSEPDLLATCERAAHHALERTALALRDQPTSATAGEVLEAGLRAALCCVAEDPALARLCLVDVLALGSSGLAQRDALLDRFVELLDSTLDELTAEPRPPLAAEMVVGGVAEVVQNEVRAGRGAQLPGLAPQLATLWLAGLTGD